VNTLLPSVANTVGDYGRVIVVGFVATNQPGQVGAEFSRGGPGSEGTTCVDLACAYRLAALKERKPTVYEPAMTKLGYLLGAEAQKPPGSGRCDSTWCWDHHLWLAIDARG
jgi:hypothetical protein